MLFSRRYLPVALSLRAASVLPLPERRRPGLWARTELYFGTNRPQDRSVTDYEFSRFINTHVTRRFPGGMTLRITYGQFVNSAGELIREKSFVVILFYPQGMHGANQRIQEIRERYKHAFQQESVLRVDSLSLVSF
jgi:hypothetical protein